jgi:bacteriocin-like protein
MPKLTGKKLKLSRETLRQISDNELKQVVGGEDNVADSDGGSGCIPKAFETMPTYLKSACICDWTKPGF